MDGTVFESTRRSAVKVHEYTVRFQNELAVYRRLTDEGVERICGASIPKLLGVDDARLIIELTTVRAPYVLDFAASRLDVPPDFDAELWQHWREEKEEEFGPHWPSAMRVFDELRLRYGI